MEIKATELRIGNYVSESYSNGVFEVVNINSDKFEFVDMNHINFKAIGRYPINSIKPIPLTSEILLKSGFEIGEKRTYSKEIESLSFCVYIDGEILELNSLILWQSDAVYFRGVLKYVHQLQNIYFSLIGEELEIKF